ncbi:hypothetical protein ACP4OV_011667 [Aristida adscensionis]
MAKLKICRKCIHQKLSDEDIKCCPVCSIDLGCAPLENLRADRVLQCIRSMLFPAKKRKVAETSPLHPAFDSLFSPSCTTHGEDHSAKKIDASADGRGFMSERLEWPDPLQPSATVVVDDPQEAARWAGFEDVMSVVQSSITTAARALNDAVNPFRDLESCSRLKSVLLARHRSALCDVAERRSREAELEARVAALEAEKASWSAERQESRLEAARLRTGRDTARKERNDALKERDEALGARDAAVLALEAKGEELKKAEDAFAALRDRADAAVATAKSKEAEAEGYKKVVDQVRVGLERLRDVATQVCDSLGVPAQTGAADVSARVAQIIPRVGELELEAFRVGSATTFGVARSHFGESYRWDILQNGYFAGCDEAELERIVDEADGPAGVLSGHYAADLLPERVAPTLPPPPPPQDSFRPKPR